MKIIEFEGAFVNADNITAVVADRDSDKNLVVFGCGLPPYGIVFDYPVKEYRDETYNNLLKTLKEL